VTDDMIRGLDDSRAVRVLTTFARVRLCAGDVAETEWTPELDRALRQDFPAEADAGRAASVSEGDLARQALLLLADDPQNREALTALIEGPPPESFEVVGAGTVALLAAMLVGGEVWGHPRFSDARKWVASSTLWPSRWFEAGSAYDNHSFAMCKEPCEVEALA